MIKIWFYNKDGSKDCLEYPQGLFTVGRDNRSDFCIPLATVSSKHATLSHIGGKWLLSDLESTNGTLVNGEVIERKFLNHGDKIHFGGFSCWIESKSTS